jgi:hypothetical protein
MAGRAGGKRRDLLLPFRAWDAAMASLIRFALLILLIAVASPARTNHRDQPLCSEASAKKIRLSEADLTVLGLTIGHSSLKDVQAKLGSATSRKVSREDESDIALCYVSQEDATVLVFYSGAMGGWADITEFEVWGREAMFPRPSDCSPSNLVSRSLSTQSGIKLGLATEELARILGTPSKSGRASIKYECLCRRKMTVDEVARFKTSNGWDVTGDPYFNQSTWVDVRLNDSKVSRVQIGKIESY